MSEKFLSEDEKIKLEEIAQTDSSQSQWARAVLALNEGSSYAEAGKRAGLTARQARYQRDKFLRLRMGMVSGASQVETAPETAEQSVEADAVDQAKDRVEDTAEQEVSGEEKPAAPEEGKTEKAGVESEEATSKITAKDSKKTRGKKGKGKGKSKGEKGKKKRKGKREPVKMTSAEYEAELAKLEIELVKMQGWIKDQGLKVVVIFEGRDSAGKGGTIKRITRRLNPRIVRVVALGTPTEKEKTQFYFQRYISQLPSGGEMVLFDRSWYNRAGVEKVMGFCTEEEYMDFLRLCPRFEQALVDSGIMLIKYWLHISDETQEARFQKRIDDPRRRWKLSPMDLEARARWVDYSKARDVMFEYTDTDWAPWYVVDANIKRHARLNVIAHLLSKIPYKDLTPEPLKLPKRQPAKGYRHPPVSHYKVIPTVYPGKKKRSKK